MEEGENLHLDQPTYCSRLESNPGHTHGRQALSSLRHPCSPKKKILQNLRDDLATNLLPLSKLHKDLHFRNLTFDHETQICAQFFVFVAVNNVKCQFCDMTCPNASALKQHVKFRHSAERPFKCDVCSYT